MRLKVTSNGVDAESHFWYPEIMFFSKDFFSKIRLWAIETMLAILLGLRVAIKWTGRMIKQGLVLLFRPLANILLIILRPLVRIYLRLLRFFRETGRLANQYVPYVLMAGMLIFGVIGNIFAQEEKSIDQATGRIFESFISSENEDILITEEGLVVSEGEAARSYISSDGVAHADTGLVGREEGNLLFNLPQVSVFGEEYVRPGFGGTATTGRAVQQYIVRTGDTIGGIAERFGISIYTILWANKLTLNSTLRAGQQIDILPTSGVAHRIRAGDTIASIAKKYKAKEEEIAGFNQLSVAQVLIPGEIIVIPGGQIVAPPPPPRPTFQPLRDVFVPNQIIQPSTGRLLWPVPASRRITQYYGRYHTGVDIAANYLTPIVAVGDGIVELVQFGRTGYGYQTIIDHENGYRTRYGHQSQIFVKPGDRVSKGQTIGTVGSTGKSTGPHLHFEVYVNGRRANPLPYIR